MCNRKSSFVDELYVACAKGMTNCIETRRDSFGRSTGYTHTKGDATQHTVTTAYGADGRISGASFLHGGQEKQFGYTYLQGSHLLQTLTKPNGMTLTQTYEQHRDLLTQMDYKRGNTLVARRSYQYDTLGRPTSRTLARQGVTRNDVFTYNNRSELISNVVDGTGLNGWDYDRAVAPSRRRCKQLWRGKPLQAAPAWQTAPCCSARWVPASP